MKKLKVSLEFKKWLKKFLKENKGILQELAKR